MPSNGILLQASGDHLPEKYSRIAEIIYDYNPELELAWIPPSDRNSFDREPFAIFHNSARYGRYLIGTFREDQMDHRIIAHLFKIDRGVTNVLSDIEAEEAARKALKLKEQMEENEAQHDFMKSVLQGKHYYRHNGKTYS